MVHVRSSRVALCGVAVGALLLLAAQPALAADGDDDADIDIDATVQLAIDAVAEGDLAAATRALRTDGAADALAGRPQLLHVLLDRVYRFDDQVADADEAERTALVSCLQSAAATAAGGDADSTTSKWVAAHATMLGERHGEPRGQAGYLAAAALVEQIWKAAPGDGDAGAFGVTFLIEGMCSVRDDGGALGRAAKQLTRRLLAKHAKSDRLARSLAGSYFWGAEVTLEPDRKTAKGMLKQTFDVLERHATCDEPQPDTAVLWNQAVTFARRSGFAMRRKYITDQSLALGGRLCFDVPRVPHWIVSEVAETDDTPGYVYVTEVTPSGERRAQLIFRRYIWGLEYPFGEVTVNGDNVKRLVRALQDLAAEQVFEGGGKRSKIGKAKLSSDLSGSSFQISGETRDDDPEPLQVHGYVVRGHNQASFAVLAYVYDDEDADLGPELESVLASMKETDD